MNYVSVFCGSNDAASEIYTEAAKFLARAMQELGFGLIFGGANRGLMGKIAAEFPNDQIIGVTIPDVTHLNINYPNIDIIEQPNAEERLRYMYLNSIGCITLPGGEGTAFEFAGVNEFNKWNMIKGLPAKPNCVFNVKNFFDGLEAQMQRCHVEGFTSSENVKHICFSDNPHTLLEHINSYKAEEKKNQWWHEYELPGLPEFPSVIQFSIFKSSSESLQAENLSLNEPVRRTRGNRA